MAEDLVDKLWRIADAAYTRETSVDLFGEALRAMDEAAAEIGRLRRRVAELEVALRRIAEDGPLPDEIATPSDLWRRTIAREAVYGIGEHDA
jgi:hypothetical protein